MILKPWAEAMESQLHAISVVREIVQHPEVGHLVGGMTRWENELGLLRLSQPFHWSSEVSRLVWQQSQSVPLDTALDSWNLDTNALWWHFEEPLPVRTTTDAVSVVRALHAGWMRGKNDRHLTFQINCWVNSPYEGRFKLAPSQTWRWDPNETVETMLARVIREYRSTYNRDRWRNDPTIASPSELLGEEGTLRATESIAKFLLASMAWLGQKLVTVTEERPERHRRKDFERQTEQKQPTIKVIELRKRHYTITRAPGETEPIEKVEWSHRWLVEGHWRNQPYGPGRTARKLIWINPFVKGPEDKPLQIPQHKVYAVRR